MNYVISNNLSLKYQKFTSIDFKDIGILNFEFVTKTQFLLSVKMHKKKHLKNPRKMFMKYTKNPQTWITLGLVLEEGQRGGSLYLTSS